jgi:hypothetical protein
MRACTVCGTENDDLAVVCSSCKSFLQAKVDNLNLFETLWGLMESPRTTFRKIALARHKNYAVLLSSLLGISLAYTLFWFRTMGPSFASLATLVGAGILLGPFLGVAFVFLFAGLMHRLAKIVGGNGTFRNTYAVASYAGAPIVYSLVFVFPIEIAIFGMYFFANNPPPLVISPVIYLVLLGMSFATFLWSLVLLIEGTIVAHQLSRGRAVLLSLLMMVLTGLVAFGLRYL